MQNTCLHQTDEVKLSYSFYWAGTLIPKLGCKRTTAMYTVAALQQLRARPTDDLLNRIARVFNDGPPRAAGRR